MTEQFTGIVKLDGIEPYVEVPPEVVARLGTAPTLQVLVMVFGFRAVESPQPVGAPLPPSSGAARTAAATQLSGEPFKSAIVTRPGAPGWLALDEWIHKGGQVLAGDVLDIALQLHVASPSLVASPSRVASPSAPSHAAPPPLGPELPDRLRSGLEADPAARRAWGALPPARQKEILGFLKGLKTPAAQEQNIDQFVASLTADAPPGSG